MNIVQSHERVRFWVDIVSSTRFESEDIDNALNTSIDNKVRESYDQNRPMNRSDSFQRVQRIRDELGPLVQKALNGSGIAIIDDHITYDDDIDFAHLLALRIRFGDGGTDYGWHPAYPTTYDRQNITSRNPFRRVRMTPQSKTYFNEEDGGINIFHDFPEITDAEVYYLKTPAIVNYGIEYTSSKTFSNSDIVIAIEETVYAGTTYVIGQKFIIVTPNLNITSGIVVHAFVECNVRSTTHEEIARRAAINCLLTAGENEKIKALREEIVAS